jgi:aryl-alcohol dehydrogenase
MALLAGNGRAGDIDGRQVLDVIQGDAVPQDFIPRLIGYYRQGRFPFDRLLTFYDFADINRAIADEKSGTTIKAVLRMGADAHRVSSRSQPSLHRRRQRSAQRLASR